MQRFIHPNHPTPIRQKIQKCRIWMRFEHFVQQERLLARSDQFSVSNLPHCHVNMHSRVSVRVCRTRIESNPCTVCLKPRGIGAEIHVLTACRHSIGTGGDPRWPGVTWSFVIFLSYFPTLRLGL